MKLYLESTPTVLRSAFVAPTLGGSVAGVCPKAGFRADDHSQVEFRGDAPTANAGMTTGHRSWSPLIT